MNLHPRFALLPILLAGASACHAGSFHRCDDGSGTPIYQTVPCAAGTRTVARHEYVDPALPKAEPASDAQRHARRAAKVARMPSSRARSGARRTARIGAYACKRGTREWTQAEPCVTGGSPGNARQRTVSRDELCRQVRDGSYRNQAGERVSDSAYGRNRFRESVGC
jgi:hypothetical protein